jgi:large subunit ribosomal protein L3
MLNTIFAKKIDMNQAYSEKGKRLGVTILSVPTTKISAVRNEKNGYWGIQLDIDTKFSKKHTTKKEVRIQEADFSSFTAGEEIKWEEIFQPGDTVNVSGISKGHGFAGVVKRHHFRGGPRTHGQSNRERSRGSSGSTTTPGRVLPGKRMAGRMGNEKVMVRNLKIVSIDAEKRILILDGSVPGAKTSLIKIIKV